MSKSSFSTPSTKPSVARRLDFGTSPNPYYADLNALRRYPTTVPINQPSLSYDEETGLQSLPRTIDQIVFRNSNFADKHFHMGMARDAPGLNGARNYRVHGSLGLDHQPDEFHKRHLKQVLNAQSATSLEGWNQDAQRHLLASGQTVFRNSNLEPAYVVANIGRSGAIPHDFSYYNVPIWIHSEGNPQYIPGRASDIGPWGTHSEYIKDYGGTLPGHDYAVEAQVRAFV